MVWYSKKIVNGFSVIIIDYVRFHIQATRWKVYMCIQFVSPIPIEAKTFQTYDKDAR